MTPHREWFKDYEKSEGRIKVRVHSIFLSRNMTLMLQFIAQRDSCIL